MIHLSKWIVCVLFLLTCGCWPSTAGQPEAAGNLTVVRLFSSAVCGGKAIPGLSWIETGEGLRKALKREAGTFSVKGEKRIGVDFERFAVLRISMGQKPTGGYDLALADPVGRIQGDTLVIRLDWIEPGPDAMVTQMITSPCLLLKVPLGGFRHVEVRDQRDTLRCRLDI